jgi:site-specific DNA-methyltransferase (adenine-specific)
MFGKRCARRYAARMKGRQRTSTSNFGAGRRESHDATRFYERFRSPSISTDDSVRPPAPIAEPFICEDARHMDAVEDGSVALVVTSPPYFAGKQYEEELERDGVPSSYLEYLDLLTEVFAECVRKLEPGGRIAVNVANLGRKPYRSLSADVIRILEHDLGLLLRGELIWQKAEGASGSCAWGSYRSATNPVLRDISERVIIASKGRFDRARSVAQRIAEGLPHENTLATDDFLALTLDIWSIPPERARRVGHPAPFPIELPEQLIRLYTFAGDLVLDPFMGSGSALVAAALLGRRYVGYDLEANYVELARQRVAGALAAETDLSPLSGMGARQPAALAVAEDALLEAGFTITAKNKRVRRSGVAVSFVANDAEGATWLFDVCGSATTHRGGLLPSDVVWRSLGRAHALRGAAPSVPLVLLTTAMPRARTEGDTALRAAGPEAFFDAVDLASASARQRLARYAKGGCAGEAQPGFWAAGDLARRLGS